MTVSRTYTQKELIGVISLCVVMRIVCSNPIILDEKRIYAINEAIALVASDVHYLAITKDMHEKCFDNYCDLLRYDNYSDDRISKLLIKGYNTERDITVYIRINWLCVDYLKHTHTVQGFIQADSIDICHVVEANISSILTKAEPPCKDALNANPHTLAAILQYLPIMALQPLRTAGLFDVNALAKTQWFIFLFLYSLYCVMISFLLSRARLVLLKTLYPPVVFLWGEEETRYRRVEKLRHSLLWNVLVGLIVSIIGSAIFQFSQNIFNVILCK